jgi:archaeal flagellar protein FlaJ
MKVNQLSSNFDDFCYHRFGFLGKPLLHVNDSIEDAIDAADMKIHPEVYTSKVAFLTLVTTLIVSASFIFYLATRSIPVGSILDPLIDLAWLIWASPMYSIAAIAVPIVVLLFGLVFPSIKATNRVSGLKNEIPYAAMHMTVMASGGLDPFISLLRLRTAGLLPKLRGEIDRIQSIMVSTGRDPIAAMESAARVVEIKEYKELFLGYASTLRTGGDAVHYLYAQTESMFKDMAARIKGMGESLGALMEAYTIIEIMGGLGLYMLFIIGFSLPGTGVTLSTDQFFLFSFIVLPMVSALFLYLTDTQQMNYPTPNYKSAYVFLLTLPITFFVASQMCFSYFFPDILIIPALQDLTTFITTSLSLSAGNDAAVGLTISLMFSLIPAYIIDRHYSIEDRKTLTGITNFLRDLVENRKTGLSPEKCFQILAERDYKGFSKYLKRISSEINWGLSYREVFEDFKKQTHNWLAHVNIFLLIDSMEVGGGTIESLESLAHFSESTRDMEKERKAVLTPLLFVPYIGAALLVFTTVILLQFFNDMLSISQQSLPMLLLNRILLAPLIINAMMLGLVTGKTTTGRTSAGFKHAIILVLISLAVIWFADNFKLMTWG